MTNWVCKDFYFFEIFGGKTERQSDLPSQSLQTAKINSSCGKICAIVLFQSYQKRIKAVKKKNFIQQKKGNATLHYPP